MRHPRGRARPRAASLPAPSGRALRADPRVRVEAPLPASPDTFPQSKFTKARSTLHVSGPCLRTWSDSPPHPGLSPHGTFPQLTERVEVLDSGHTIRFLFLGGNGLRKAAAGEGGRGGRSVGKRGGSRGRLLSPRRRLSDWGGGAAPVFTYIAAPVTPARCPHVPAPPTASWPPRPGAAASDWSGGGEAGRRLRRNSALQEGVLWIPGEVEGGGKGWYV